ncbi:MAG: DUF4157 domain-containing protein [Pyrinomonadaceae bacterium]|nr:DUF4157 domain-containing protein [Pyrinomonadaceae bacterium]
MENKNKVDTRVSETDRAKLKQSGGTPLPPTVKHKFETQFQTDLSGVRVHTGENAIRMTTSLGAKAYTQGEHIVFAQGQYNPHSSSGQQLLAHELTHVVQQGNGGSVTD